MNNFYCCNKKAVVNKNVCCNCFQYQECVTRELNTTPGLIGLALLTVAAAAAVVAIISCMILIIGIING